MPSTDAVLFDMLTTKFNVPEEEITPEATMDELDIDSLALAELALALREESGVKIEDHEATKDHDGRPAHRDPRRQARHSLGPVTRTSRAIAVTGLGMITPAGDGSATTWAGVRLGTATAARDTQLKGMPVDFSCRVPDSADPAARIGRKSWRIPRFAQLAVVAAREAVADAGLDPRTWDGARVAVIIGSGLAGVSHLEEQTLRLHQAGPER